MGGRAIANLDNQVIRDSFVVKQLSSVPNGSRLLDAGCGSQRYRQFCGHLNYYGQDLGEYVRDDRPTLAGSVGGTDGYMYGQLDYVGDICAIEEVDGFFDVVLCTEVFEHIPYPAKAVREFSRLLKPGGSLILTLPSNSLRHMDPYWFYTGFSDRWIESVLPNEGFEVQDVETIGDYYRWIAVEISRSCSKKPLVAPLLMPAFAYFISRKPDKESVNSLCFGYHVVARKV